MDVDNLLAGQRFDIELEKALGETDVFLAVIGPRWLELLAERQARGERDYVREEIAGALQRGIVVVPVLSSGRRCRTQMRCRRTSASWCCTRSM